MEHDAHYTRSAMTTLLAGLLLAGMQDMPNTRRTSYHSKSKQPFNQETSYRQLNCIPLRTPAKLSRVAQV
jgi:hypothetical protein